MNHPFTLVVELCLQFQILSSTWLRYIFGNPDLLVPNFLFLVSDDFCFCFYKSLKALLRQLRIHSGNQRKLTILDDISGIVRPGRHVLTWFITLVYMLYLFIYLIFIVLFFCRLTLLLGPPSSGKTTLLLALAGRLKSDLKVQKFLSHVLLCYAIIDQIVKLVTYVLGASNFSPVRINFFQLSPIFFKLLQFLF